ncbi:MAG: Vitamin B12 dependent methionine synthase activation subunit [Treponema sp.]|nr:Vitamin B12 dependent methionine synthase activation subunit [Treponema sp.]
MKLIFDAKTIIPYKDEVYRYLGYKKTSSRKYDIPDEIKQIVLECIDEMQNVLKPQLVYEIFPIEFLKEIELESKDLNINLRNCSHFILFAATIGPLVDKLLLQTQKLDIAKSLIMQTTGAMFIESLVDKFRDYCKEEASKKNFKLKPRFSPGFGDLTLKYQRKIFDILKCEQQIALTLNDSLVMSPEKSVTAFIGLVKL